MDNKKVCVIGMGGVGGFIGCMLAKHFDNVYFFARGKRLEAIRQNGLKLCSNVHGEIVVHPKMASNNAEEMGAMDYIFLCVKNFSLEQVCAEILPMIKENTVIIPLLNGVGVSEEVRRLIGKGTIIDGLVYIISGADKDFVIHHTSSYCNIRIGYEAKNNFENSTLGDSILLEVGKLLQSEEITCIIEKDIKAAIWEKYILNCAFNVITAYYNTAIGELRKNETAIMQVKELLNEACKVARELKINIDDNLEEIHFNRIMYKQSDQATSSLQRDMAAGRQSELEVFSGKLLQLAASCEIKIPTTEFFYEELKKKC
ncbi:ketopantoate reductase family protein [Clostridium saccharoperbutylacetonicum]|uniref:ketopantoate reductase family protein n=1 Tax=Clostridium saccharoperbutylacetonicum TaxID=36745 RepID=UPI0039E7616B